VVGGEDQRAAFVTAVGRPGERLVVCSQDAHEVDADDGAWGGGTDASSENVLELVRKRAARERRELTATEPAHFAGWDRLATPGIAMTELDSPVPGVPQAQHKVGDLARSALAAADRRPLLRPVATAARVAYRSVSSVLGRDRSD
jgi:hypothetical protein